MTPPHSASHLLSKDSFFRYFDQGLIALIVLAINLIPPQISSSETASHILYQASWILLGSSIAAALFGVPIMAIANSVNANVIQKCATLHTVILAALTPLIAATYYIDSTTGSFLVFTCIWATIELMRKSALSGNRVASSLATSLVCVVAITCAMAGLYLTQSITAFWLIATAINLPLCLYYLASNLRFKSASKQAASTSAILKAGLQSSLSFILVWLSTQGLFILLYKFTDNSAFIEQKTLFSLLGVFTLLMTVQENRFQPLYRNIIFRVDAAALRKIERNINVENSLIAIIALFTVVAWYFATNTGGYIAIILLYFYRLLFASAKKYVYFLRARNLYRQILLSNLAAFIAALIASALIVAASPYAISYALAVYSVTFYLITRSFYSLGVKRWN
ncbi:hypothetical protein [Marinobacter sp. Hex_13]|uniref:hypothetical protein n=1 Tax=Marinobacter sp. Hex_13 TaxID=1795866 RepID=UPI0007931089|nr:hypothetical protein [Marinobacter sp. Hex_13]KXJ47581.1 MAG: hypothetical protein AXW11_20385 [Marinobacter sp. Hex_13]